MDMAQDIRRSAEPTHYADSRFRRPVLPRDAHRMGLANLFAARHDLTVLRVSLFANGQSI